MRSTVAIIGGNGFVGKNFTKYFLSKDYDVIILDHSVKEKVNLHENVKEYAVDIHHTKMLIDIIKNVDYVIWLVHASVPSTQDDSLVDDFTLNISPIIKFLEKSAALENLKKFIYISSGGTIYGDVSEHSPINEEYKHKPISNYGLSKSVAEKYIEYITRNKLFESIILRPSNIYGPFQNLVKPQGIIGYAFKAIKNNQTLDIYDGGKVVRDFIYVDDVAKAVEKCLSEELKSGNTQFFNVGSNEGFSILQILQKIEIITEKKLQINHKSSRSFDCEYNVLDTLKINKEKNWNKEIKIEEGLLKVWEWIKSEN